MTPSWRGFVTLARLLLVRFCRITSVKLTFLRRFLFTILSVVILDNISAFPTCVGPIYTLLVEIIFLKLVLEPTSNVLRSANVLVGKYPGQQMSWSAKFLSVSVGKCLGWQMSGSANVWAGKCLDQVSKCQIGKCLDRQMSVMVSICPMSNVGRKMSGPGNVRPYNVLLPAGCVFLSQAACCRRKKRSF